MCWSLSAARSKFCSALILRCETVVLSGDKISAPEGWSPWTGTTLSVTMPLERSADVFLAFDRFPETLPFALLVCNSMAGLIGGFSNASPLLGFFREKKGQHPPTSSSSSLLGRFVIWAVYQLQSQIRGNFIPKRRSFAERFRFQMAYVVDY